MKIKVGATYYDSDEEIIMVVFDEAEKEDVAAMVGTVYTKMCKGPSNYEDEQFKKFMDLTEEEERNFTERVR
jgi:phage baseplate assembly protein gpV